MEEKIIKIIEKIRNAFSFNNKYKNILNCNPKIVMYYINNKFVIHNISFSDGKMSIIVEDDNVLLYDICDCKYLGRIKNVNNIFGE